MGNAVVVFEDKDEVVNDLKQDEVLQENHYYPFGMNMNGIWDKTGNDYQYNGKELNEDLGLDLSDYGARWYDAGIARFTTVDPLADSYFSWSPYNYVMGNPIIFIDPDGRSVEPVQENKKTSREVKTIHDFGVTQFRGLSVSGVGKDGLAKVNVHIMVDMNPELYGMSALNAENPGLANEVETHENAHVEQWMECAQSCFEVEINGQTYGGQIDGIFTAAYDDAKKTAKSAEGLQDSGKAILQKLKNAVVGEFATIYPMSRNPNDMPSVEKDAVKRTSAALTNQGVQEIYSNGSRPIKKNGEIISSKYEK